MRKFCLLGFLFGLVLSCALTLESYLIENAAPGRGAFGPYVRFFWPSVVMFALPDPKFSADVILILRAISIGANGLFYAFIGLVAYYAVCAVERIVGPTSVRQIQSD